MVEAADRFCRFDHPTTLMRQAATDFALELRVRVHLTNLLHPSKESVESLNRRKYAPLDTLRILYPSHTAVIRMRAYFEKLAINYSWPPTRSIHPSDS